DGGGLVDVGGDALDAAHEDEHIVAYRAEAEGHQQGPELGAAAHVVGFGQVGAEQREEGVQEAEALVEDGVDPHGSHGNCVDDVGDVNNGLVEGLAAHAAGEDGGEQHRDQHDDDAAPQPDLEHVEHGIQEDGGVEQGDVV